MNEGEAVSIWLGVETGEVPKQLGGERKVSYSFAFRRP
jgi:hypothetical protein